MSEVLGKTFSTLVLQLQGLQRDGAGQRKIEGQFKGRNALSNLRIKRVVGRVLIQFDTKHWESRGSNLGIKDLQFKTTILFFTCQEKNLF